MINLGVLQVVLKAKDQLSGKIKSVAGVALAAGAAIAKFTKDTIDLGTELADLRSKTGVGVQALQEFKFAGEQAGVNTKQITDAVINLGRRTAAGLPDATKELKKLGLSVSDIVDSNPEEAFALVSQKLEDMGPGAKQAAAAMGLFGRAGIEVLPAINQGLQGNIERFRELGSAMSVDQVNAAKALGDSLTDLSARWTGIKTTIGSVVIPALQNVLIFFSDLLPGAIQKAAAVSVDFVAGRVEDFRDLANALAIFSDTFVGVGDTLGTMAGKMRAFADNANDAANVNFAEFGAAISGSMGSAAVATEAAATGVSKLSGSLSKLNLDFARVGPGVKAANIATETFGVAITGVGDLVAVEAAEMSRAMTTFGLQTQAQLNETARVAESDFRKMEASGKFTASALDAAWKKYETNRQKNAELTTQVSTEQGSQLVANAFGQLAQLGGAFKIFALAQAGIATALSVARALAGPPPFPWSIPIAAAAGVAGAVQIGKINSQSGFQQGTPGLDFQNFGQESLVPVHGNEAIIPQGGGHALAQEIATSLGSGGGGRAVNVTNHITLEASIQTLATNDAELSVRLAPMVNDMLSDGRLTTEMTRRLEGIFAKA